MLSLPQGCLALHMLQVYFGLLFISYKFVKHFLTVTFLLLLFSHWNFLDVCQLFYVVINGISVGSDKKMRNFPIDPHCKIAHIDNMALSKCVVFTMGFHGGNAMSFV